ncbi:hypothetical protein [Planctomycetes bacterium K23_9]|uniref:Uncharacterized protein n=1 Tax=Stieleria marina TaxID=1930275 RepID=A0A517NYN0_9BACT|nr:hypothetical protein K239x_42220 [Planctomycetes bacterium K23_9]
MNHNHSALQKVRHSRLVAAIGEVVVTPNDKLAEEPSLWDRPWVATVSSRLGHNPVLHRDVCRQLANSMVDCRRRGAALLVAKKSAIYPWAMRAAELFSVPVIELVIDGEHCGNALPCLHAKATNDGKLSRDSVTLFLADRVDALYARRNGKIDDALRKRVELFGHSNTRVAVSSLPDCAAKELIQCGVVGWFAVDNSQRQPRDAIRHGELIADEDQPEWMHRDGDWLVHCTRACVGPWPGQTEQQYRDELLLGDDPSTRTPLDTLTRIVRSRRLLAGAVASAKAYPVVCFSAVALSELLVSRSYRQHLKRWDYEPWGIAIRKSAAIKAGIQEVIYGNKETRKKIDPRDQYRFQAAGKTYDWTAEREWRSSADVGLDTFDRDDVRVYVASEIDRQTIEKHCPWPVCVVWQGRPSDGGSV